MRESFTTESGVVSQSEGDNSDLLGSKTSQTNQGKSSDEEESLKSKSEENTVKTPSSDFENKTEKVVEKSEVSSSQMESKTESQSVALTSSSSAVLLLKRVEKFPQAQQSLFQNQKNFQLQPLLKRHHHFLVKEAEMSQEVLSRYEDSAT